MIPKELEEPAALKEAFEVANRMSWSKEELDAYDTRGMLIQDERGRVEYAHEDGLKKGFEKGEKSGLEKGKQAIALTMLNEGMNIETISRITGLPIDEIEKEEKG